MATRQGKGIVTWALIGTGAVVVFNKASSGEWPSPQIFLALASLFVILGFLSDVAPMIAGPLAVLVFLAVLLSNGGKTFESLAGGIANRRPRRQKYGVRRSTANLRLVKGGQQL